MTAEPFSAILFDAVGTLLHPLPSVAEAYASVGWRFGSRLSEVDALARFRAAFSKQEQLDSDTYAHATSESREHERWRAIVADVLDDVTDCEATFAALWDHFAQPEHWRLDEDAAAVWRALAARGVTLGIASNFDARLTAICSALAPLSTCEHVFASSLLGWRKPSRQFFAAIEQRLSVPPELITLVGDDLENDYLAARAAGWQAVLVDRAGKADVEPRIIRLAELPALVSRA